MLYYVLRPKTRVKQLSLIMLSEFLETATQLKQRLNGTLEICDMIEIKQLQKIHEYVNYIRVWGITLIVYIILLSLLFLPKMHY